MPKIRRAVAVTCIALVVLATILPLGSTPLVWLVVTPIFTFLPPVTVSGRPLDAPRPDERLAALLAILDPRGPPPASSLA